MKSKNVIMLGVMGMLIMIPAFASAEEAAVGASAEISVTGSAGGTVTPPAPPASADSWSFGESNPQMPPPRAGEGRQMDPRKPLPIRESPTLLRESPSRPSVAPRDSASGQATGKRMIASGTPMNDEQREKMEERREEMMERMVERRGEMMERMASHMITKMRAAVVRLTKLADRLDSRIAKLKAQGVSTATAEANIAIARTKIAEASATITLGEGSIASAVLSIDSAATGTAMSTAGKGVRDALEKARAAIKEAHKALVLAITSVKANVKVEVSASSSATTP